MQKDDVIISNLIYTIFKIKSYAKQKKTKRPIQPLRLYLAQQQPYKIICIFISSRGLHNASVAMWTKWGVCVESIFHFNWLLNRQFS